MLWWICRKIRLLVTVKIDRLHWSVLCFSAELIYEEVIDWEERNKNGLMKEDCSGIFIINCSIKQQETDSPPVRASNFRSTGSFVCLLYQTWCRSPPPSHHRPTTSRPCPRSKPWPPTQTAAASTHWRDRWTSVSEHLEQLVIYTNQHHCLHSLLVLSWFCASMLPSPPRRIGLFFYLLYFCDPADPFQLQIMLRELTVQFLWFILMEYTVHD